MTKFILHAMVLLSVSLFGSEIKWVKDYHQGVQQAIKENKPIFFLYSNHNCKYCVMLEQNALKDPKVIQTLNKEYIAIVSYNDDGDYIPKELWRPGTPTLWFLQSNGRPMFEPVMGAVDTETFLKILSAVTEEFTKQKNGKK